jgi:hypothetical protein
VPVGDLTERRLTHYAGGAWRAPLSDRLIPATGGPVVAAGPADAARAFRLSAPGPVPDLPGLPTLWPALARVAAAEGAVAGDCPDPTPVDASAERALILAPDGSTAAALVAPVWAALGAGAAVVLLPPPTLALTAMALAGALHDAGLPSGRFALLQGDANSAAALAAQPFDRVLR